MIFRITGSLIFNCLMKKTLLILIAALFFITCSKAQEPRITSKSMDLVVQIPKSDPTKTWMQLKEKINSLTNVRVEGYCPDQKLLYLRRCLVPEGQCWALVSNERIRRGQRLRRHHFSLNQREVFQRNRAIASLDLHPPQHRMRARLQTRLVWS